ncbi:hypothetical protein IFM89_008866 [Coptis chinensis]|uniref:CCHC-type domain-containing protein n=1 Tax=Coptis chinensis TaxID=261450 RepID=A0A835HC46_9MAGN|nr:hypothetical protein IFM89_008866 [Coptis chinensis]
MKHRREFTDKGKFNNQVSRPHDRFKTENRPDKSFTDFSKVQCYKCNRFGHYAHNCPTKLNKKPLEKRKANISITWDDSDDEIELDDSQADEIVKYVVYGASLCGDLEESDKNSFASSKLNNFESSVTDDDWAEMYSNSVAKCIKLDKINKIIIVKFDALNAQVLSGAEEYNIQAELFEQEKQTFLSKIDVLERKNFDSEEKCKSILAELEQTKKDLVFTQHQLQAFTNGAQQLDKMLGVGKSHSDKRALAKGVNLLPAKGGERKTRLLDVVYNASNNELVRTQTLVKSAIIQVDAAPFRQWYLQHYGVEIGRKKKSAAKKEGSEEGEAVVEEVKKSQHVLRKLEKRKEEQKLDSHIEEQFGGGRLLACISSRPGQCGRADGYILEGKELEFYMKKLQRKKGKGSVGAA